MKILALTLLAPMAVFAAVCEDLSKFQLSSGSITLAESVPADRWPAGVNSRAASHPPFCRVAGTLKPSADSEIRIEVWLPSSGWNGRYQAVGNGGWSGSVAYGDMVKALVDGYVTFFI